MVENMKKAWGRFLEGYSLTPQEQLELDDCTRKNRDNVEAIMGGYSAANRKFQNPDIPSLIDRVLRGVDKVFER